MRQFAEQWDLWAAQCLAHEINPHSRDMLQVAFYCGAMTWARLVYCIMSEHTYEEGRALLDELHHEMSDYAANLQAGQRGQDVGSTWQ